MPELGSLGSVRGALRNERPYRERDTATTGEICQPVAGSMARSSLVNFRGRLVSGRSARRHSERRRSKWERLPMYPRCRMS